MDAPLQAKKSENVPPPGADSAAGKITVRLEFEELVLQESDLLFKADPTGKENRNQLRTESAGPAGEPWVSYAPVDRVGLAFSGGGIRSATFNLGVLKALHELGLLKHVDYLSTVSGGGYIGAWWSAWRARWGKKLPEEAKVFPIAQQTNAAGTPVFDKKLNREPEEVRHLREFSNFLSPRIGFFQSETWNAIMAVLSAMLPAVVVASSVIALAFLVWLGFNSLILADALKMALPSPALPKWLAHFLGTPALPLGWIKTLAETLHTRVTPLLLVILTITVYICFELKWGQTGKAEGLSSAKGRAWIWVVMPLLIIAGLFAGWSLITRAPWMNPQTPGEIAGLWEWSTGISPDGRGFSFSPYLFAAPILWAGIALLVFVPRLGFMRIARVSRSGKIVSAIDRALSRMLGAAVVVAGLGVLWLAGCWLNYTAWGTQVPAGGALVSGGAFALLRNWIGRMGPQKKGGIMDLVKPMIPPILAYIAIALWAIFIAALIAGWIEKYHASPWLLFAIALGIVLFAAISFDPAQVSMHSFYRNRLSRAYLGASNPDAHQSAEQNRQTDVRRSDDIQLRHLSPEGAERPIHLVCCTANDIGGDHLENLSRGSRSAVLSKFGFAIGNYWHAWEKEEDKETLGLGSAITASAAAFNSNMGSLSMTLGAGVTFLCTALNLRLGLWLSHPLAGSVGAPRIAPGRLFLGEMFGLTNSGLLPNSGDKPKPVAKYVHLSDGAHFENLALYELVRRHCRYIIVSDCGADPEVAFDDFGNAMRRIREDFGVEIEIDLSPLKPNAARLSKQHVAVGIITYDPRGDRKDTAVLLYLKPALTGDEPGDITQYRTRNEDFPHESTSDQFYDEAQWESYRRLGEHAVHSALRFVERMPKHEAQSVDAIFNGARWEWYQALERREEKILEVTGRLTALEQQLRDRAPSWFVNEMYPELKFLSARNGNASAQKPAETLPEKPTEASGPTPGEARPEKPTDASGQKSGEASPEEIGATLHFLTQMIQLMEDTWFAISLDTHWTDPNNIGWINLFQRWAYTPSFRLWWPILKPMYGRKFRRFMEERFSLSDEDYPETLATVKKHTGGDLPKGVAQVYWKRMHEAETDGATETSRAIYIYELRLTQQREEGDDLSRPIQAGLAFIDLSGQPTARWNVEDFFLPPSLWGAGLGAVFLSKLLPKLKGKGFTHCEVTIEEQKKPDDELAVDWSKRTDLASRQQLNDLLAFYQRAEFSFDGINQLVRDLKDITTEPE